MFRVNAKRSTWKIAMAALSLAGLTFTGCSDDQSEPIAPQSGDWRPRLGHIVSGSWTSTAPMPTERQGVSVGAIGGKLYVAGGSNATGNFYPYYMVGSLEVYDPATNTWATKAPMPIPVSGGAGVGVIGNKLYIAGGFGSWLDGIEQSALQIYDPATDTWTFGAPMPVVNSPRASVVIGGKLYVTGGSLNDDDGALRVYDPVTNAWSELAHMDGADGQMAAAAINGKMYVVGGAGFPCDNYTLSPNCIVHGTLRVYDPATDTWNISLAPMPTARLAHVAVGLNGKLHVVGGAVNGPNPSRIMATTHEVYDPATDTWTTAPAMPTLRDEPGAAVIDGRMYVVGGATGLYPDTDWKDAVEVFTPTPGPYSTTAGHLFLQPINQPPQAPSVFKIGSTIPVKFKLFQDDGVTPATSAVATIQVNKVSNGVPSGDTEAVVSTVANQGVNFRYDSTSQQYIFNLSTKGWSPGTYRITALLDDGSQIVADVGAK